MLPKEVSQYVCNNRNRFEEVEILYCPYIVDDHWVSLCIDIAAHEITVLQPDPTISYLGRLKEALHPLVESLLFLNWKCAYISKMKADLTTPFDIINYSPNWQIRPKGSHEVTTILVLQLHASGVIAFTFNLDEAYVKEAGKNFGIKLFEKYISPIPLATSI